MGWAIHNNHIVKDVAEESLVQGFAGDLGENRHTRAQHAVGAASWRRGVLRGFPLLTLGVPQRKLRGKIRRGNNHL